MSPFFLKVFKSENACRNCKKDQVSGYKMCREHLIKARDRWRRWATERKAVGRCVSCHRRGFNSFRVGIGEWRELRCTVHKKINTLRCRAWIKRHPDHNHQKWLIRKAAQAEGICGCKEHRPIPAGQSRCDFCMRRKRLYYKEQRA